MAKPISAALIQEFPLEGWDSSKETKVTIRQARQHEQEKHDNLYAETTRVWDDTVNGGQIQVKQRVSVGEVQRTEVYLTLVGSNIEDESGPVFKFKAGANGRPQLDMTPEAFEVAWGKLPPELADEIHSKVREVNPQWGPLGKGG